MTINYNSSFVLQMLVQPGVDRRGGGRPGADTESVGVDRRGGGRRGADTEGSVGVEDTVSIRCVC